MSFTAHPAKSHYPSIKRTSKILMRRLILVFAGSTYNIVGNAESRLKQRLATVFTLFEQTVPDPDHGLYCIQSQ